MVMVIHLLQTYSNVAKYSSLLILRYCIDTTIKVVSPSNTKAWRPAVSPALNHSPLHQMVQQAQAHYSNSCLIGAWLWACSALIRRSNRADKPGCSSPFSPSWKSSHHSTPPTSSTTVGQPSMPPSDCIQSPGQPIITSLQPSLACLPLQEIT